MKKSLASLLCKPSTRSVRDEEIDTLRAYKEQGLNMFAKAALRLEAVRVLVAG